MSDEEFDQLWTSCDWRDEIDQLRAENEKLKAELADRTTLISRLNRELAIYREREKTMGWNQGD